MGLSNKRSNYNYYAYNCMGLREALTILLKQIQLFSYSWSIYNSISISFKRHLKLYNKIPVQLTLILCGIFYEFPVYR